jgi:2-methylcitrate dehydratase PrpD
MNETRLLAGFVSETGYADLPPEVIEAVRIYILDDLASGFAGARTPWASMVASQVQADSKGACSLFGRDWTTSAAGAALLNGVAIGGFETDHPYTAGSCHPSGAVFPAAMAAAELTRIDGREFLTAIALGYEALCRVGAAATRAVEDERGFHGPGTNAPFGGAFGAGRVLGVSTETLVNALGIAGSHGGGLLEFFREGSMTKRLHLGRGAQLGLESVLLAQRGFTGPSTVIEGERGFLNAYSPAPRPDLLLDGLGHRWLLLDVTLKSYPCHISFHAVIDAIHRFRQEHAIDPGRIESVTIRSEARMMESRFTARAPTSLMGAQYSLPWSTALALCEDATDPAIWTEAALENERVNAIAAEICLLEDAPAPPDAVAEIVIVVAGHEYVVNATGWKGAPTDPYTFDDMAEKFRRYASSLLPPKLSDEIVRRVRNLEAEREVASLIRMIRAG